MSAQHAIPGGVNRNDLIQRIRQDILSSPTGEVEVSATAIAKDYGVEGPTINYHLKRFINEGLFEVSPKKGRYNRQIFVLPESERAESDKPVINDMDAFKKLLQVKVESGEIITSSGAKIDTTPITVSNEPIEVPDEPIKYPENIISNEETVKTKPKMDIDHFHPLNTSVSTGNHTEDTTREEAPEPKQELMLDDKIRLFIERSKKVPSARELITRQDKEILSVMTETIQQQVLYMKDLSDQLSLVENLALVQSLIDERNKMLEEMEQIKNEQKILLDTVKASADKNATIEPKRVRLMQQVLINTVDNYLELPNHSLALQRNEFRGAFTKELSDLSNYVLNLEK